MKLLKQSTARNILVFMTDAVDMISGKTGLTLTIEASKDGAAFASISPTVTERGNGFYNLALTTAHTDTLGDLALYVTGSGANPLALETQVVVELPGVGAADISAIKAKTDNLPTAPASSGEVSDVLNTVTQVQGTVEAIKESTDNLPSDPAEQGLLVDQLNAIQAKTDNLPASPASAGQVAAVGTAVAAVGEALADIPTNPVLDNDARLDYLDAAVSTRTSYIVKKNTAYSNFGFMMVDSAGDPAAGLSVTAKRSIDGGALASCSNSVSEVGNGLYKINLSAADLNGKHVVLQFAADDAMTLHVPLVTQL